MNTRTNFVFTLLALVLGVTLSGLIPAVEHLQLAPIFLPVLPADLAENTIHTIASDTDAPVAVSAIRRDRNLGLLPLHFANSEGQLDERVAYYIQDSDNTQRFTTEWGLRSEIQNLDSDIEGKSINLGLADTDPEIRPVGQDKTVATTSYLKVVPDERKAGLPAYDHVSYLGPWSNHWPSATQTDRFPAMVTLDTEPTVVATMTVGTNPWGVGVNPTTNRIYVANNSGNNVTVIDGVNDT